MILHMFLIIFHDEKFQEFLRWPDFEKLSRDQFG